MTAIAASEVLIGAVDSEFAGLAMNDLAHALCLPYLDAGSGVLVSRIDGAPVVQSGGQVRLVVPGVTSCLLCNFGIDREAADREVARRLADRDSGERTLLERSGYIRGLDGGAEQPSVAHLNFLVAARLMNALVEYMLSGLPPYHALHVDLGETQWMARIAEPRPGCGVCRTETIGHGRLFSLWVMPATDVRLLGLAVAEAYLDGHPLNRDADPRVQAEVLARRAVTFDERSPGAAARRADVHGGAGPSRAARDPRQGQTVCAGPVRSTSGVQSHRRLRLQEAEMDIRGRARIVALGRSATSSGSRDAGCRTTV